MIAFVRTLFAEPAALRAEADVLVPRHGIVGSVRGSGRGRPKAGVRRYRTGPAGSAQPRPLANDRNRETVYRSDGKTGVPSNALCQNG